jgi:hypothetical protein
VIGACTPVVVVRGQHRRENQTRSLRGQPVGDSWRAGCHAWSPAAGTAEADRFSSGHEKTRIEGGFWNVASA